MEDNILKIESLTKHYKAFSLENVNLELKSGFIMGIIGENGAGKTTLIKLIMNLVNRDSGKIEVFGKDNLKFEKEIKDRIGFVYDSFYGYDSLSLYDNSRLFGRMYSNWDNDKFNYYMNKYGLNKQQKLKELSKGMRMKFAICMALSHHADLLILDEPTSGLDPVVRSEILEELQSVVEDEKKGVIISTHITTDIERIADYITFIKEGRIIFSIPKEEMNDRYYVVKGDNKILSAEAEKLFLGVDKGKFGFEALTDNIDGVRNKIHGNLAVEKASIEDIMILYKSK